MTRNSVYRLLPAALFIIAWQLFTFMRPSSEFFFGSPLGILRALISWAEGGRLTRDASTTILSTLTGLFLGNLAGTLIGLGLWFSKSLFELSKPYIVALGSAPLFALAPLIVIWFGTGFLSKVVLVVLSVMFVALYNSYMGAVSVEDKYLLLFKSLGARKTMVFRKLIVPSSIVWVVSAYKMNVGFAILGAFLGEYISSDRGLGHFILVASGLFDISRVLAGVLVLVLFALIVNSFIASMEKRLLRWVVESI